MANDANCYECENFNGLGKTCKREPQVFVTEANAAAGPCLGFVRKDGKMLEYLEADVLVTEPENLTVSKLIDVVKKLRHQNSKTRQQLAETQRSRDNLAGEVTRLQGERANLEAEIALLKTMPPVDFDFYKPASNPEKPKYMTGRIVRAECDWSKQSGYIEIVPFSSNVHVALDLRPVWSEELIRKICSHHIDAVTVRY